MSDIDNQSEEELDAAISFFYRPLGDAAVPVKLQGRAVGTVRELEARRAAGRTPRRRLLRWAPAALAVIVIGAIALAAVPALQRGPGATALPAQPSASPSASPTLSPSPPAASASPTAFTSDPSRFAGDPRLALCGGLKAGIETVVALDHAWAYRSVLPGLGFIPQLDYSAEPALIVVYSGPVPPELDWRNLISRPPPLPGTTEPAPTPVPTLPPGTRNVCLAIADAEQPQIVERVSMAPIHPELASLSVRPPTPAGQARVVTRNKQSTYSLAWDGGRGVLWYTVQFPQTDSALYRLDPATGDTKRWALPATDDNGFIDVVVVDATGAVWLDQSGEHLYRLDPTTGGLARHDIDLNVKTSPGVNNDGTYITAIAADGDGVLIARESLAYLTRVDASLHEVQQIPIPNDYAGTDELGVVGDRVIIGGKPDVFGLCTRQGELVKTLPLQRWLLTQGPDRVLSAGSGLVAVGGENEFVLVDASGNVVSHVPLALDLPIGPFGDTGLFESNPIPQTIATDWQGTFWYALGTYIVEVHTP